jgi:hypothetical protein
MKMNKTHEQKPRAQAQSTRTPPKPEGETRPSFHKKSYNQFFWLIAHFHYQLILLQLCVYIFSWIHKTSFTPTLFLNWSACIKLDKWATVYLCVRTKGNCHYCWKKNTYSFLSLSSFPISDCLHLVPILKAQSTSPEHTNSAKARGWDQAIVSQKVVQPVLRLTTVFTDNCYV